MHAGVTSSRSPTGSPHLPSLNEAEAHSIRGIIRNLWGVSMAGYENYGLESGKLVDPSYIPHFLEISQPFSDNMVPLLDQNAVSLRGITADQQHWRDHGYVIKKNFIDHGLIDEYLEIRRKLNLGSGPFPDITPYLNHSVIRDICCSRELNYLLVDLLGEELGVHFLLADFKSTERGWHQDDYLNPADTMSRYAAVWMAMGDVDPDSGPFEFIPGSHKWPCLRRDKVQALVAPEARETGDHTWAVVAEYFVNKSVDAHIKETGADVAKFIAKKGDILIWHGKLMHRGSIPINSKLLRPGLIAHYSNVRSRRDFGAEITRHNGGGYFWEFSTLGRPLTEDTFPRIAAVAERDALAAAHDAVTRERDAAVAERDALAAASTRWFDAVIAITGDHNPLARMPRRQHTWWRKRARRLAGEQPMVLANRARDAGKWELAVRYYRDALDVEPDDPEIWAECGHALKKAGKTSEAEVAYQKSRELTAGRGPLGASDSIAGGEMPDKTTVPSLAASGANIPLIGLGTSFLRDAECVRAVETALSLGYRHIDTAVMYGNEVEVGQAIKSSGVRRDELFITTKILPEEIGEGDLQRSAAGSLARLGLDYVDLLLLHWPNAAIPLSISVKALCDAKKLGVTRHIGVANFPTKLLEAAVALAADHGERLMANQCEYHPRLDQTKLLGACRAKGIVFVSHTPLGQGRLADDPTIVGMARRVGKTPAQILLRWNIQQPGIVTVPKSAQPTRLAENLQVFDFELSDKDMNDLFAMASADGRMVQPATAPEWD
jgi:diketogulonate reductase-like aldo/keto reductase